MTIEVTGCADCPFMRRAPKHHEYEWLCAASGLTVPTELIAKSGGPVGHRPRTCPLGSPDAPSGHPYGGPAGPITVIGKAG